jgi:type I restriction enzyme M protein
MPHEVGHQRHFRRTGRLSQLRKTLFRGGRGPTYDAMSERRSFRRDRPGPAEGAGFGLSDFREKADFLWDLAEILRGDYKPSEYGRVILPLVVLRRLDCVLEPTKDKVLAKNAELKKKGIDTEKAALPLRAASGQQFYNVSKLTFEKLLGDQANIADQLRAYIAGFDPAAREIVEKFKFNEQITHLDEADLLYLIVKRFCEVDLHPEAVDNVEMGLMFEDLIRRFSEQSNETAGEHFTPREVVTLMVNLLFAEDDALLKKKGVVKTAFDPACGTGGMLSVAEEYLRDLHPQARLEVFGQELNDESYAICRSDLMLKGHKADNIVAGNSFTKDGFVGEMFDYMLSNPPFGVEWKKVEDKVRAEAKTLGMAGRFGAGLPRINDGSLLFLQHMIAKMKPATKKDGGSRIAIVFNASPLFTGAAESGESEIRRWIIDNDWLEAIVALPDQLFYNTGIPTYIWIVTNRKPDYRKGKVQLIDARKLYEKMPRSLGNKRHRLSAADIETTTKLFANFEVNDNSLILDNDAFAYHRIQIERPLRLRWELSAEAVVALDASKAFLKLDPEVREKVKAAIEHAASNGGAATTTNEAEFKKTIKELVSSVDGFAPAQVTSITKLLVGAATIRDPDAPVVTDTKGAPLPDPELRDSEHVPFGGDIAEYFEREVKPYLPDAWVDFAKTRVGYEIPLTRYFHRFEEPRPLKEIDADIKALEGEILELLKTVTE